MASKLLIFILLLCLQTLPTFQRYYEPYSNYDRPEGWPNNLLFIYPPRKFYDFTAYIDLEPITKSLSHKGYNFTSEIQDINTLRMSNSKMLQLLTKITIFAPPNPNNNSSCSNLLIGHCYPGHFLNHVIRLWVDRDELYSSSLVSPGSLLPVYIEAAVPFNIFINGFEVRCSNFGFTSWDGFASLNNLRIKGWNISTSHNNFRVGDWTIPEKQYWVVRLDIDSKFDLFSCN